MKPFFKFKINLTINVNLPKTKRLSTEMLTPVKETNNVQL